MANAFTSQVNEKLYHAKLLLTMQGRLHPQSPTYKAEASALEGAARMTLLKAYQLFLCEIAENVSLSGEYTTATSLSDALQQDGRTLAIASRLAGLESEEGSWVNQTVFGVNGQFRNSATQIDPLALVDVTEENDTLHCINKLQAMVEDEREFFQEW